jgi:alkanesulfonate monooxygenase SsuD/methylene tetrahydromethanopterin reductase-like flavin-dependent oxidoreductase (luciferase family)
LRVGIGLPNTVPGTRPDLLIRWAELADEGPWSSLGVLDRVPYDSYDPMTLLAAAAGVTSRIALVTMVITGPLKSDFVLAKEAATIHSLSGGRLTLGLGLGARPEDYDRLGVARGGRGDRLDGQLAELRDAFEGGSIGPAPNGGPDLLVGGGSDGSLARAARYADGYVHGGGPPRAFLRAATRARAAWSEAGRPGDPQLWAQAYFALGDTDTVERGRAFMRDYYAFAGPFAEKIAAGLLTTRQSVVQFIRGYAEAGCDELVLLPAVAELEQVDRLAQVVGA